MAVDSNLWRQIAVHISEAIRDHFISYDYEPISGSCINQVYCLKSRNYKFFVKINSAQQTEMMRAEFLALIEIKNTGTINVPTPICLGADDRYAFLVLEWLELSTSHQAQDWHLLGQQIAKLHQVTSKRGFGWHTNNTIGSTLQLNGWHQDWQTFWTEYRLKPQLEMARRKGFYPQTNLHKLWMSIPSYFQDYQPIASLVHGDLWSGNHSFCDGQPVIYDPAIYYGDREVDIAMTELFGRLPRVFYESYNLEFPLDRGYQKRKHLYNLYHILNHFNLFGGIYAFQADDLIAEIVA